MRQILGQRTGRSFGVLNSQQHLCVVAQNFSHVLGHLRGVAPETDVKALQMVSDGSRW